MKEIIRDVNLRNISIDKNGNQNNAPWQLRNYSEAFTKERGGEKNTLLNKKIDS